MFFFQLDLQLFAHKKGGGSAATNRNHDSNSKRRGVKVHDGEKIKAGMIIIRQLGSKYLPGKNVYLSRDYTMHARESGIVRFYSQKKKHVSRTFVEIIKNDLNK